MKIARFTNSADKNLFIRRLNLWSIKKQVTLACDFRKRKQVVELLNKKRNMGTGKNVISKIVILIINAIYLIATIIWCIIEKSSFEPVVAIIGGIVSLASFFVANDNSMSVKRNITQVGINNKYTEINNNNGDK
jgi:hypothetical protein